MKLETRAYRRITIPSDILSRFFTCFWTCIDLLKLGYVDMYTRLAGVTRKVKYYRVDGINIHLYSAGARASAKKRNGEGEFPFSRWLRFYCELKHSRCTVAPATIEDCPLDLLREDRPPHLQLALMVTRIRSLRGMAGARSGVISNPR